MQNQAQITSPSNNLHPPQRKIIHCDCDCFYAAVEMLDRPELQGRPIAIGGAANERGVVATCNYPARAFGIKSAMPMSRAVALCPQLLILPANFERYRQVSQQVMAIYQSYTRLVEPLSLDEAYLDVSDSPHYDGNATKIAENIRSRVVQEIGITVSAGVAPNKFLAKIASDWNKPDGLFIIKPHHVKRFIHGLPVNKLWGVGAATAKRLHALNIHTCADLQRYELSFLIQYFGRFGARLYELARGIDHRAVEPEQIRKSISVETTFNQDKFQLTKLHSAFQELFDELHIRIEKHQAGPLIEKVVIKLKFSDFTNTTAESIATGLDRNKLLELLEYAFHKQHKGVRLLGLGVRLRDEASPQLSLPLES